MKIVSLLCICVLVNLRIWAQPAFNIPGFYNEDGSVHEILDPFWPWGDTVNVLDYGADPLDNATDDRPAIEAAISSASQGDLIYFPNGVYNMLSASSLSSNSHIVLRDGYHLHGESMEGAIIKSQFPLAINQNETSKTVRIQGLYGITIKNLTFTSDFSGTYWTDRVTNNPDRSAPGVHLYIDDSGSTPSRRVTVDSCTFEKYRATGIRLANASDCIIRNSKFSLATDVGGGGAGYGISVQGNGHGVDSYGLFRDSRYNLIENNTFTGPHIRHGIVLQYFTHNNLIRNNTLTGTSMDALDLHGEDEYNNELSYNTVSDVTMGGGVGVGNTGVEHDASGYNNYIHHNTIRNCREGIKVYLGSPFTLIEDNTIENFAVYGSRGIYLMNAPHTSLKRNVIKNNTIGGFVGIHLEHDPGTLGSYDGDPEFIWMDDNQIHDNTTGIWIEQGKQIFYGDGNQVYNNTEYDTLFGDQVTWRGPSSLDPAGLPDAISVLRVYPNPFNGAFSLNIAVAAEGPGTLQLLDLSGRLITTLLEQNFQRGEYSWQSSTITLASGLYFLHFKQGNRINVQKIMLVR